MQPPIDEENLTPQYIGNIRTAEVHDSANQQQGCHLDEIAEENRAYFTTLEAAQALNYDGCAHCLPSYSKR